jgi:hypothetical protein
MAQCPHSLHQQPHHSQHEHDLGDPTDKKSSRSAVCYGSQELDQARDGSVFNRPVRPREPIR